MANPTIVFNSAFQAQGLLAGVNQARAKIEGKPIDLKLNTRSLAQPLGRITGDVAEFTKSLQAATARVTAFGATSGGIILVGRAISETAKSVIEVDKQLTELNTFLGQSQQGLSKIGDSLFQIAKKTASSFEDTAEAAKEFARQGLSVEETLKRTNDALVLSRISGLGAAESVNALTTAVNSFNKSGLSSEEIINKLIKVDSQFAVSSNDLAQALSRVGSSAQDSGVSFDQLNAAITTAQQTTGRGGAVIGNALKTIFTRLKRPEVIDQLKQLGVAVQDQNGFFLDGLSILKNYTDATRNLGQAEKARTAELLGGVFQINVLNSLISDLSKSNGIYARALQTSSSASDEATKKNNELNKSLESTLRLTKLNFDQKSRAIGEPLIKPLVFTGSKIANAALDFLTPDESKLSKKGEEAGESFAQGMLKSLGQVLAGPGLILVGSVGINIFRRLASFSTEAVKVLLNINSAAQNVQSIEQLINNTLGQQPKILQSIASGQLSREQAAEQLLALFQAQNQQLALQKSLSSSIAPVLAKQYTVSQEYGLTPKNVKKFAGGIIPSLMEEKRQAMSMGAPASVQPFMTKAVIGGVKKDIIANTGEKIIPNYAGGRDTAIIPSYRKFEDIPRMANGYVPNFANIRIPRSQLADLLKTKQFQSITYQKPNGEVANYNAAQYRVRRDKLVGAPPPSGHSSWTNFDKATDSLVLHTLKEGDNKAKFRRFKLAEIMQVRAGGDVIDLYAKGRVPNFADGGLGFSSLSFLARSSSKLAGGMLSPRTLLKLATGEGDPKDFIDPLIEFLKNPKEIIKTKKDLSDAKSILQFVLKNDKIREAFATKLAPHISESTFSAENQSKAIKSTRRFELGKYPDYEQFLKYRLLGGQKEYKEYASNLKQSYGPELIQNKDGSYRFNPEVPDAKRQIAQIIKTTEAVFAPSLLEKQDLEDLRKYGIKKIPPEEKVPGPNPFVGYTFKLGGFIGNLGRKRKAIRYEDKWDVDLHKPEKDILDEYLSNLHIPEKERALTAGARIIDAMGARSYSGNISSLMLRELLSSIPGAKPVVLKGIVKIPKDQRFAGGYVPNFGKFKSSTIKLPGSGQAIRKTSILESGSDIEYVVTPDGVEIKFATSKKKGEGHQLFDRVGKIAKRLGRPLTSGNIIDQPPSAYEGATSVEEVFKKAFPQLVYRQKGATKDNSLNLLLYGQDGISYDNPDLKGKNIFDEVVRFYKGKYGDSVELLREKLMNGDISITSLKSHFSKGYIPNFGGLSKAINREQTMTGLPASQIMAHFDGTGNPIAVTNKRDEKNGLKDVPNFAAPRVMGSFAARPALGSAGTQAQMPEKKVLDSIISGSVESSILSIIPTLLYGFANQKNVETISFLTQATSVLGLIGSTFRGFRAGGVKGAVGQALGAGVNVAASFISATGLKESVQTEVFKKAIDKTQDRFNKLTENIDELSQTISQLESAYSDPTVSPDALVKLSKKENELLTKVTRANPEATLSLITAATPKARQEALLNIKEKAQREKSVFAAGAEFAALKPNERDVNAVKSYFSDLLSQADLTGTDVSKLNTGNLQDFLSKAGIGGAGKVFSSEAGGTKLADSFVKFLQAQSEISKIAKDQQQLVATAQEPIMRRRQEADRADRLRRAGSGIREEYLDSLTRYAGNFGERASIEAKRDVSLYKSSKPILESFQNMLNTQRAIAPSASAKSFIQSVSGMTPSENLNRLIQQAIQGEANDESRTILRSILKQSEYNVEELKSLKAIADLSAKYEEKTLSLQEKLSFGGGAKTSIDASARIESFRSTQRGLLQYRLGSLFGSPETQTAGMANYATSLKEKFPGLFKGEAGERAFKGVENQLTNLKYADLRRDLMREGYNASMLPGMGGVTSMIASQLAPGNAGNLMDMARSQARAQLGLSPSQEIAGQIQQNADIDRRERAKKAATDVALGEAEKSLSAQLDPAVKVFSSKMAEIQDQLSKSLNDAFKSGVEITNPTFIVKEAQSAGKQTMASGFIPNFSNPNPLTDAISREHKALSRGGLSNFAKINVEQSNKLKNPSNPMGLAVTNSFHEPEGLASIGLASSGYIPNFAISEDERFARLMMIKGQREIESHNKEAKRLRKIAREEAKARRLEKSFGNRPSLAGVVENPSIGYGMFQERRESVASRTAGLFQNPYREEGYLFSQRGLEGKLFRLRDESGRFIGAPSTPAQIPTQPQTVAQQLELLTGASVPVRGAGGKFSPGAPLTSANLATAKPTPEVERAVKISNAIATGRLAKQLKLQKYAEEAALLKATTPAGPNPMFTPTLMEQGLARSDYRAYQEMLASKRMFAPFTPSNKLNITTTGGIEALIARTKKEIDAYLEEEKQKRIIENNTPKPKYPALTFIRKTGGIDTIPKSPLFKQFGPGLQFTGSFKGGAQITRDLDVSSAAGFRATKAFLLSNSGIAKSIIGDNYEEVLSSRTAFGKWNKSGGKSILGVAADGQSLVANISKQTQREIDNSLKLQAAAMKNAAAPAGMAATTAAAAPLFGPQGLTGQLPAGSVSGPRKPLSMMPTPVPFTFYTNPKVTGSSSILSNLKQKFPGLSAGLQNIGSAGAAGLANVSQGVSKILPSVKGVLGIKTAAQQNLLTDHLAKQLLSLENSQSYKNLTAQGKAFTQDEYFNGLIKSGVIDQEQARQVLARSTEMLEQKRMRKEMGNARKEIAGFRRSDDGLSKVRTSLMERVISGKITPQQARQIEYDHAVGGSYLYRTFAGPTASGQPIGTLKMQYAGLTMQEYTKKLQKLDKIHGSYDDALDQTSPLQIQKNANLASDLEAAQKRIDAMGKAFAKQRLDGIKAITSNKSLPKDQKDKAINFFRVEAAKRELQQRNKVANSLGFKYDPYSGNIVPKASQLGNPIDQEKQQVLNSLASDAGKAKPTAGKFGQKLLGGLATLQFATSLNDIWSDHQKGEYDVSKMGGAALQGLIALSTLRPDVVNKYTRGVGGAIGMGGLGLLGAYSSIKDAKENLKQGNRGAAITSGLGAGLGLTSTIATLIGQKGLASRSFGALQVLGAATEIAGLENYSYAKPGDVNKNIYSALGSTVSRALLGTDFSSFGVSQEGLSPEDLQELKKQRATDVLMGGMGLAGIGAGALLGGPVGAAVAAAILVAKTGYAIGNVLESRNIFRTDELGDLVYGLGTQFNKNTAQIAPSKLSDFENKEEYRKYLRERAIAQGRYTGATFANGFIPNYAFSRERLNVLTSPDYAGHRDAMPMPSRVYDGVTINNKELELPARKVYEMMFPGIGQFMSPADPSQTHAILNPAQQKALGFAAGGYIPNFSAEQLSGAISEAIKSSIAESFSSMSTPSVSHSNVININDNKQIQDTSNDMLAKIFSVISKDYPELNKLGPQITKLKA